MDCERARNLFRATCQLQDELENIMRYIALVDGKTGAYGVVVPDLPGCTSAGSTTDEVREMPSRRCDYGSRMRSMMARHYHLRARLRCYAPIQRLLLRWRKVPSLLSYHCFLTLDARFVPICRSMLVSSMPLTKQQKLTG